MSTAKKSTQKRRVGERLRERGERVSGRSTAFVAAGTESHVDAQAPPKEVVDGGAVEDIAVGEVGVGGVFGA